jgi:hypothetical protein
MAEAQAIPDQTGSGDKSAQIASQQPAPAAGGGDWSQAAQGAAQPTASAQKAAATPATPGAAAGAPPAAPAPAQPTVITPQKRGGILGVMDSIADALTGKTRPEIGKDQDGNSYVKQVSLTHGEQWLRIAGEAIHGAAAGLAAGKGAGNMGKAALAGVEAGQQDQQQQQKQQKEMTEQARQQTLDNANNQLLRMQMAEHAYTAARLKVKASQEDEQFADKQEDRLKENGGILLGTTAHVGDISHLMAKNPQLMEDLVKNHALEFVPNYENGQVAGFKVYKTTPGYRATVLPDGAIFHTFDNTTGQYLEHKASGPITQGEIDDYNTAAGNAALKYKTDQVETGLKVAQTAEATARAKAAPAEAAKNYAEAGKARAEATARAEAAPAEAAKNYAEAEKARAEAEAKRAQTATPTPGATGTAGLEQYPAPIQAAVKGLLDYRTDPATFPQRKFAKSGQVDRETAIGLAQQIDPSYDEKQYGTRHKLLQDFTSGEAATNIRSLNTAIQHLDQLNKTGAALGNTNFQAANAFKNTVGPWFGATAPGQYKKDVNAVADELSAIFKRTAGTDQEIQGWKETMSTAQTPDQIKAGIQEALTLMNGRYDALSHQYETGMGRPRDFQMLSPESTKILEGLGAKEFVQKDAIAQPAAPPAGATYKAPGPDGKMHWTNATGTVDYGIAPQ